MPMLVTPDELDEAIALLGGAADLLLNQDEPFPRMQAAEHIYGEGSFTMYRLAVDACVAVCRAWGRQFNGTEIELLQAAHDLDEGRLPPGWAVSP